jgi:hypothetical protein
MIYKTQHRKLKIEARKVYLFGIFKLFLPQSLVFCVVFYRSLFVLFLLVTVLSALWFTASDYLFGEKFEDTKEVIRGCKSKNRQYSDQKKKDKQWSIKHNGHCIVCSLIYSLWLPLWYLQTFLASIFSFMCSVCR